MAVKLLASAKDINGILRDGWEKQKRRRLPVVSDFKIFSA